jgi:hypothetical protein
MAFAEFPTQVAAFCRLMCARIGVACDRAVAPEDGANAVIVWVPPATVQQNGGTETLRRALPPMSLGVSEFFGIDGPVTTWGIQVCGVDGVGPRIGIGVEVNDQVVHAPQWSLV